MNTHNAHPDGGHQMHHQQHHQQNHHRTFNTMSSYPPLSHPLPHPTLSPTSHSQQHQYPPPLPSQFTSPTAQHYTPSPPTPYSHHHTPSPTHSTASSLASSFLEPFHDMSVDSPLIGLGDLDPALGMDLFHVAQPQPQQQQPHHSRRRQSRRGGGASDDNDSSAELSTPEPPEVQRSNTRGSATRKQRGRPRLHTKDENAADRRRTQIRLAQRAYRQRKETTIISLKKRVNVLEAAIESLQRSFFELHDIDPDEQGSDVVIKDLKERVLAISRAALGSSSGGDQGDGSNSDVDEDLDGGEAGDGESTVRPRSRDDNEGAGTGGNGGSGWSYANGNPYSRDSPATSSSRAHGRNTNNTSSYTDYNTNAATAPSPPLTYHSTLSAPAMSYTYTLSATPLSRQLHIAALQHQYALLLSPPSSPSSSPSSNNPFTYPTTTTLPRPALINILTRLLASTPSQSLHLTDRPDILPAVQAATLTSTPQILWTPEEVERALSDWDVVSQERSQQHQQQRHASTDSGIDHASSPPAAAGADWIFRVRKDINLAALIGGLARRGGGVGVGFLERDVVDAIKEATATACAEEMEMEMHINPLVY